jgi:hypothetical protein
MRNVVEPASFEPRSSIFSVSFFDSTNDGEPADVGNFDGRLLKRDKWLDWNGSIVSAPCGGQ